MKVLKNPTEAEFAAATKRPAMQSGEAKNIAATILAQVKAGGMKALLELSKKFDKSARTELRVPATELAARAAKIDPELAKAIDIARGNIERFHAAQSSNRAEIETSPGVTCWRREIPIQNVGLYIPGGTAPLYSTALMLTVPAKLAGCERIAVCTPPDAESSVPPSLAYICKSLEIEEVYCIGGAQAVGLLAYGADGVQPVSKIFGPGNQFVTCAKELVAQEGLGIDMPAGPSEVLVIADDTANPAYCAADLLAQAEHGADSQVVFLTNSERVLAATVEEVERQCGELPRAEIASKALASSAAILTKTLEEGMTLSNSYAPEHLILAVREPDALAALVINAGSVFLGHDTPESLGDYASGTNHTLPTSGYARVTGGVSLESFMRKVTFQRATKAGLESLGPVVVTMARGEGLEGHARAVTVRLSTERI